jgi:hypothetical protein
MKEAGKKCLATVPAPLDFVVPSRSPRKVSFVLGWAWVLGFVVTIVSLASLHWVDEDRMEVVSYRDAWNATVRTTARYGLRTFSLRKETRVSVVLANQTTPTLFVETSAGLVAHLTGVGRLGTSGPAALGLLITACLLCLVAAMAAFLHGWSKIDAERLTYIAAVLTAFVAAVFSFAAFVVYAAGRPTDVSGFVIGWGCWLALALSLVQFVLVVAALFDKPTGFVRYSKGEGVIRDQGVELPPSRYTPPATTPARQSPQQAKQSPMQPPPVLPPPRVPTPSSSSAAVAAPPPQSGPTRFRARFSWAAEQEGDLSFHAGDIITFVSAEAGSGWTVGELNGKTGNVPDNFLELV